jgi:recombination DNA repair RAD52 pathway protein
MRYENTIGKIIRDKEYYDNLRDMKAQKKLDEENNYYRELTERYYG